MSAFGKFSVNFNGFSGRVKKLVAEHPENRHRAMVALTALLETETKKRTPILTGQLTSDVRSEVQQYKQSEAAVVYIPVNAPSASYAVKMHEGDYRLGEFSEQKQAKVGVAVGPKYITRAIDDNVKKMETVMVHELSKPFNGGSSHD